MSGISSTRIANWTNVNCGNKFDPFRVTIKPPFLGVVIDCFFLKHHLFDPHPYSLHSGHAASIHAMALLETNHQCYEVLDWISGGHEGLNLSRTF
jgi:hypothetical protein